MSIKVRRPRLRETEFPCIYGSHISLDKYLASMLFCSNATPYRVYSRTLKIFIFPPSDFLLYTRTESVWKLTFKSRMTVFFSKAIVHACIIRLFSMRPFSMRSHRQSSSRHIARARVLFHLSFFVNNSKFYVVVCKMVAVLLRSA